MSAKLYFSNSPSVLLDRLSRNLEWTDPFASPHIATPTPAMKRWVQMRLADARGILANVEFLQLERTLWRRLEELDAERVVESRKPARLLDEQGLQLLILGLLRRNPPAEVAEYLAEKKSAEMRGGAGLFARRLCQLSQKLAGFFREYEYSRVQEHGRDGLAFLWKHGRDCFQDYLERKTPKETRKQVEKLERWQKAIYHELFRPGGLRDALGESTGQYQYTLPQYAEMVLAQAQQASEGGKPPSYHLFGLSQISSFHRSLIRRLSDEKKLGGRHARFFIYSLNPCAEYWEDARTRRERRKSRQEDLFQQRKYLAWHQLDETEKRRLRLETEAILAEELPLEEEDNPLLSQWGKPGRENIQLWCQVTDYDFFSHFQETPQATAAGGGPGDTGFGGGVAAGGRSLLATVQDSILTRRGRLPDEERRNQDDTLQIFACPEIHREVETVHDGIVSELLADPTLRPDEIAVLVPDMNKYRHVLAAVFGRTAEGEAGHVPYNLSDASASGESEYARAVAAFFELSRGRFSRRELFALAGNVCFRSGVGLDEEALKAWMGWTGKLNIFHSFDGADKQRRGYPSESTHTWSHGLDRLVLGTVMDAPPAEDARSFDGVVPFSDGHSPDRDLLQGFLLTVQGLFRDLAPLRDGRPRAWGEWLDLLSGMFDRYLSVPEDQALEGYVQMEVRRYLTELRRMDELERLLGGTDAGAGGVTAEIPMDLILARIQNIKAGREPHLAGGVNVSGLAALRSLPFKHVYILGLGEGEFPEEEAASTLDLRQYRRVIGDVDPAARNRYLFLEALICTSAKLRLSYVSRDVRQGKAFQMCSVLNELVDYLESCVLAPDAEAVPPATNPTGTGAFVEIGKPARYRIVQVPLLSRSPDLFAAESAEPWQPPRNHSREERLLAWIEKKKTELTAARGQAGQGLAKLLRTGLPDSLRGEIFPDAMKPATPAAPAHQSRNTAVTVDVPLDDIRRFLENPAQYSLRKHLGIRDNREEDPMDLEDEPFFCPFPKDIELLEQVFNRRLSDWESDSRAECRRLFLDQYENLALRGLMPESHFRVLDRDLLWEKAEAAMDALDPFFEELRHDARPWSFAPHLLLGEGGARPIQGVTLRFPPLILTDVAEKTPAEAAIEKASHAASHSARLHGHLPNLFRSPGGGCATVVFMTGNLDRRRLLPAFIFYAAGLCSASPLGDWLRAGPFSIQYVCRKPGRVGAQGNARYEHGKWPPFRMQPEAAKTYLQDLLARMLAGPDFDFLPFDLISNRLAPQGKLIAGEDYAEALREEVDLLDEAGDFPAFTPTESLEILAPRIPEDAETKIRTRLGPFFNWIVE